jgi:hypothetical protein
MPVPPLQPRPADGLRRAPLEGELPDQHPDLIGRRGPELRLDHGDMLPAMVQGSRWVPGRLQGSHQAERGKGGERFGDREPAPPHDRRLAVTGAVGSNGQSGKRLRVLVRKPLPPGLNPALELGETCDVKAIRERPPVQADCHCLVPRRQGRFEPPEIHVGGRAIQAEKTGAADERLAIQRVAQREECLLETVPGVKIIAVRKGAF